MKKVLLLSCGTGQGHNSCAEAIKEYLENRDVPCEILDPLCFISKRFAGAISWGHSFIYRYAPGLFRWGYQYSEDHPGTFHEGSDVYELMASGAEGLHQHIDEGQYDTIICTHVFAAIILTHCLEVHPRLVRTAFVATDYTCYPGLDTCEMKYHFISDDKMAGYYIQCGASPAHVIASGIPIRQGFWTHTDKKAAKEQLGVAPTRRHLVVAGGSMGAGPMTKLLKNISMRMTDDMEVSVLCGTNQELQEELAWRYGQQENIHISSYTDQIPLYLDSADLYMTKPGGVSITEAAVKCVPMAFVNAVAGCERYNLGHFVDMGAAISAASPEDLAEKSVALLCSPAELWRMESALQQYRQPNGAERIFQELSKGVCDEKRRHDRLSPI